MGLEKYPNKQLNDKIGSLLGLNSNGTTITFTNGIPTQVVESDSSNNVVKTTNINYDTNSIVTSVSEIYNGYTVTYTINRDQSGNVTSITKTMI